MKSIFQILLFGLLIIISFFFYNNYIVEKKVEKKIEKKIENKLISENNKSETKLKDQNNIIKNLQYNVELNDSGKYEIKSNLSEIIIKDGYEIVNMKNVTAIFTDKENNKLYIYSDNAEFHSSNYNTFFKENIKIKYDKNTILSNKLNFDFVNNNILVFENVMYTGTKGRIKTDNIKIDLITKNVEIFMNDDDKNINMVSF